jgi:hypothetical protein
MSWFYSIQSAGDVSKDTPVNGNILQYNSTTLRWELVMSSSASATYAVTAGTATYALLAGTATYVSGSVATATYAITAGTALYVSGSVATATYAITAGTAGYVSGTVATANYAVLAGTAAAAQALTFTVATSTYALTAGTATTYTGTVGTATYALTAGTATTVTTATYALTAGTATTFNGTAPTATYAITAGTATYVTWTTSGASRAFLATATTATGTISLRAIVMGDLPAITTATYAITAGTATTYTGTVGTATYAITAGTATTYTGTVGTATYAITAGTATTVTGTAATATYAITSGTATYVTWLATSASRSFLATPTAATGVVSLRVLAASDIPALSYVTSVAQTVPSGFTITGSPITGTGTLAIAYDVTAASRSFLASPTTATGAMSVRAIVMGDLPTITTATYALTAGTATTYTGTVATATFAVTAGTATYATNLTGIAATATFAVTAGTATTVTGTAATATYAVTAGTATYVTWVASGASRSFLATNTTATGTVSLRVIALADLPTITTATYALTSGTATTYTGTVGTATYALTAGTATTYTGTVATATFAVTAGTATTFTGVSATATFAVTAGTATYATNLSSTGTYLLLNQATPQNITSGTATIAQLSATGTLLQDNAGGDVSLFKTGLVGDATAGCALYIYRNAPEGSGDYVKINVDADRGGNLYSSSGALQFTLASNGYFNIHPGDGYACLFGDWGGSNFQFGSSYMFLTNQNPTVQQYGLITAASAKKYIQFQVNDATDNFELTRQDANIGNFDIQIPLITDAIVASGTVDAGSFRLASATGSAVYGAQCNGSAITLATDATASPFGAVAYLGLFMVNEIYSTGQIMFGACDGATVTIIYQSAAIFTATKDSATHINFYIDGGSFKVQNKNAARMDVKITGIKY